MKKFIYVFSEDDKNILIAKGYTLIKSDELSNTYVFENQPEQDFSLNVSLVYSDTMTF